MCDRKMSERGQQPESTDAPRGTNLILIKGQTVFALAEIDLNRPALRVKVQEFIGAEKQMKTLKAPVFRSVFGIGEQHDGIFLAPLSAPA